MEGYTRENRDLLGSSIVVGAILLLVVASLAFGEEVLVARGIDTDPHLACDGMAKIGVALQLMFAAEAVRVLVTKVAEQFGRGWGGGGRVRSVDNGANDAHFTRGAVGGFDTNHVGSMGLFNHLGCFGGQRTWGLGGEGVTGVVGGGSLHRLSGRRDVMNGNRGFRGTVWMTWTV